MPVHSAAGILSLDTRRFSRLITRVGLSAVEVADANARRNYPPGVDKEQGFIRFPPAHCALVDPRPPEQTLVFVPSYSGDSPLRLRTRPCDAIFSPQKIRSYAGHARIVCQHRFKALKVSPFFVELFYELLVARHMGCDPPGEKRNRANNS